MMQDLLWQPAWRLRHLLDAREVTAVELAELFLGRIATLDGALHAFFRVTPELALIQARAADQRIAVGRALGPLDGIPMSIKDNVEVVGVPCSYGETALAGFMPSHDHLAVERLRAAGAVFLGKTNMPGWPKPDMVAPSPTNPWAPDRAAGGSSAGAAAAIASGIGPLALGTDGGGSCRMPAAYCGLVGVHPTPQRSPSYAYSPAVGLANAMCSAGPISRDVRDAANLLQIIAGPDPRALFNWPSSPPDYVGQLNEGVDGLRMAWSEDLGIPSNHDDADTPATLAALSKAARDFTKLGAIVESAVIDLAEAGEVYRALLSARSGPGGEDTGSDGVSALLALNAAFVDALEARARLHSRVEAVFAQYDVLLCPTMRSVASPWTNWAESLPWTYTLPWNLLGFPAISIPAGLVRGMPVGLQLIGRPDNEPVLFRAAQAFLSLHPPGPFPS